MPPHLEIKRGFNVRSDRVKSLDIHPSEPWVLGSLFNGHVLVWDYRTNAVVKDFEVCELPIRVAKFVARKQWIIAGADDFTLRIFNYNTTEKLRTIEAHSDYIRSIAIHPTLSYVLSCSDDMSIRLWDWDKNWNCLQTFEGHSHYVMAVTFNPKDSNTFATASLDRTIKVWGLSSPYPHFTLEGHTKGVNCVDYYSGGDKPYLISGSDDRTVRVWDYQNKTCVQTLDGHSHNVSAVCFHSSMPVIISGSEDGNVRIWHSTTYRFERSLNYRMERVWSLAYLRSSNRIAIGYDEGAVMIKLGSEEPSVSMDSKGKIIWSNQNEIQTANVLKATKASRASPSGAASSSSPATGSESTGIVDGERLSLVSKDLGTCEIYPQSLQHNSNGRFVVVRGGGEYIIYTALAWRNKTFGDALDFVWAPGAGEYAIRESAMKIKTFKNFKEAQSFRPSFVAEGIFGGFLLGIRSNSFVTFYDWEECRLIRRIDICPKAVYWSENGELVTITDEQSFFILKFNKSAILERLATPGGVVPEDGFEDAFEVVERFEERVRAGIWVADCFIYTNANNRVNYCVGSQITTIAVLDRHMYLLGYIARDDRVFLIDKNRTVVSYTLHLNVLKYQTAVLRGEMEAAAKILPSILQLHRNTIANFLESRGLKDLALDVADDPDLKFDLAIQLNKLDVAYDLLSKHQNDATSSSSSSSSSSYSSTTGAFPASTTSSSSQFGSASLEAKWHQLADAALDACQFSLAEKCMLASQDLSGLLLLYTSTGNAQGLSQLAEVAVKEGKNNIAFSCFFTLQRLEDCLQLLCSTGRVSEATFFARTYLPSRVSDMVALWRQSLPESRARIANSLADPRQYPNLFIDFDWSLKGEKFLASKRRPIPAAAYPKAKGLIYRDVIEFLKEKPELLVETSGGVPTSTVPEPITNHQEEEEQEEEKEEEKEEEEAVIRGDDEQSLHSSDTLDSSSDSLNPSSSSSSPSTPPTIQESHQKPAESDNSTVPISTPEDNDEEKDAEPEHSSASNTSASTSENSQVPQPTNEDNFDWSEESKFDIPDFS